MSAEEVEALRAIAAHTPESIAVYDLAGRVLYINPTTERLFGKSLEQVRGRQLFSELFPEATGNAFHAAFTRVAAGGPPEVFDFYYAPLAHWFATRIVRVDEQIHVLARDVTDDVRRQRRLEALARTSAIVTNDELGLRDASNAIARILSDVIDADCSIALLSPDGVWLELVGVAPLDRNALTVMSHMPRMKPAGHVLEALETRSVVLAGPESVAQRRREVTDPELREVVERYGPSSVLVVPLLVGDHVLGVLIATRRQGRHPLTTDDRALASEIAPSLGLYLAHAHRRAEATSLQSRLAALADSLPALVAFIDREQRYQYVNGCYERWFGVPRESFLGRRLRDVVSEEQYAVLEPHLNRVLEGAPVRFALKFEYPRGTRDVDVQYVPMFAADKSVEGFAALVQDVTAEMRVAALERQQREGERRATRRLERLLALAGKLATPTRSDEIARVLVDEGIDGLEATLCGLFLVSADGEELVLVRERGFRAEHAQSFARVRFRDGGPLVECVREQKPVWVDSRAEYAVRYPELERQHRPEHAPPLSFAMYPLVIEGRSIGCFSCAFHDERTLGSDELTYLEVLTSHGAEAIRRVRLYAELSDASELREAMIQASPAAIVLLDEHGLVFAWNPAAERIFGWTAAEVMGKVVPFAGARHEELIANVRQALAGEVIHGREALRVRKSGESVDVELYAAPVGLSDGRTLCLGILADIAERKRVERGRQLIADASAILARSLELEESLAEVVQLPVPVLADFCCVDLLVGDKLQRIALSAEKLANGVLMPRLLVHDPARPGASRAIATRSSEIIRNADEAAFAWLARDDAHLRAVRALGIHSALSVPLIASDRVLGALSVTSKTRNYDQLDVAIFSELASHIAAAVQNASLYEQAKHARQQAEGASRAKDEFLAMLGHELRNPLAPMTTALDLMRLRAPEQLERERAIIERQVKHLSRLVDDLLDVSRITRGKVELRRERTTLASAVARAVEFTSELLERRGHRLSVSVPETLTVHADPTRLSQIIANLLSNAAKYTPAGGRIEVRAQADGGAAMLEVTDNGVGIAPEILPHIFEIFLQAPQTSARTEGGLGLGLTIVKNLVEMHGGTISAESAGPSRGTTLKVTLPRADAPVAPEHSQPLEARREHAVRRVLIVDDNEDAALLLGEVLDAHGHATRTAFDGPSALRIADEFRPDVAVLDIGLPVMDGYELAERLRKSGLHAAIRLIAVTGYGQESDKRRAFSAGFDAHVAKPVSLEVLIRLVEARELQPD